MSEMVSVPMVMAAGAVYLGAAAIRVAGALAHLVAWAGRTVVDAVMYDEDAAESPLQGLTLKAIPTCLRDRVTVEQVWRELELGGTLHRGGVLTLADGRRIPLVFTALDRQGRFLFGLEAQADGLRVLVASAEGERVLQALAQRYAFQRAMDSLTAQGYTLVEKDRPLPGGATQTLMRRRTAAQGIQEVVLTCTPPAAGDAGLIVRSRGELPGGQEQCPDLTGLLEALHASGVERQPVYPRGTARGVRLQQQVTVQARRRIARRRH